MGGTSPTVTVSDLDIGPCQVIFGTTDIGSTLGNCTVKFKYDKKELKADQFGSSILDMAITGMECTVETEFAETKNRDKWALLFPNAIETGTTHKYVDFKDATAVRQLALATALTLHPLVDASSNKDDEWYFYKALPLEDSSYVFGPAEQAKMKITWRILLDASVTPARMFRVGDHTL